MKITKVEVTEDLIHGRGGMSLLMKYIGNIGILAIISSKLGHLRKSKKGQEISEVFRQILAYFIDGSRTSISGFDDIRNDKAYAAMLEVETSQLIGSDIVKRFFNKFTGYGWIIFRGILHELFVWRLNIQQPKVIELYIDTMVLNNDDAEKREGVSPTYKQDVCKEVQPTYSYPDNLRRKLIDFAVKIVKSGRQIILKTTQETWDRLNFPLIWEKCCHPPFIL